MSKIKLTQIEPAFASPMMLFQVLDCEVLNRQLVDEAQAMRTRSLGVTRSNREGWHSEDDFFGRTEPGCTALRTHILETVQETTRLLSPHFDFAANRALCQGWINVNPPGAFNAPHDHSGFALSGVYYASVPPEGRSGAIEFLDPRANANANTIEGAACFNRKFIINPKPGNLLVFPSYLTHWVQPNAESTDRITVAFNIRYLKQSDPVPPGGRCMQQPGQNTSASFRGSLARVSILSVCVLAWALAFTLLPSAGHAQTESSVDSNPKVQQRLQEVEAMKKDLFRKMQELDNRIQALEAEVNRQNKAAKLAAKPAAPPQQPLPPPPTVAEPAVPPQQPSQTVATTNPPESPASSTAQTPEPPISNFNLKIFGKATLDALSNTSRPQAPGVPFYLVPRVAGGFPQNTFDANARQSQLGVAFTGPKIGDLQSGGRISAVFFDSTILADRNGFLLQQSYGELFNEHWRIAAGLQLDVFAPGLPTVLPFSGLGGSGSAGNSIKGQIRGEHFVPVGSDSQLTLQLAISEPLNSYNIPDTQLDEDNGWPNVEARIAFGLGKPEPIGIGLLTQRPLEVGISGVVGQLRRTAQPPAAPRRVVSDVYGVAADYRVNLAHFFGFKEAFGLKGEVYAGQALGAYNGGILQTLDAVTWRPIRAKGGWVEGFAYLTPNLHFHAGIGIDQTNPNDITGIPNTDFGRTSNRTIWSNLIWDVNEAFRLAFEVTNRETHYKEPTNLPNNGWGFHAQLSWAFDKWLR